MASEAVERRARKAAWMRAWRVANPDKAKLADRKQRENPQRVARHKEYVKAWYARNPRKPITAEQRERKNAARRVVVRKRVPRTLEHDRAYDRARYRANPVPCKMRAKKRRAVLRGATVCPITVEHLALLLEAQDGRCRYCRDPLGANKHLDHRIPLARGGAHAPDNVCWSCPACNLKKGTKTEVEFVRQ